MRPKHGLTAREKDILVILVDQKLTASQVAKRLNLHVSGVRRIINRLKKMGYLSWNQESVNSVAKAIHHSRGVNPTLHHSTLHHPSRSGSPPSPPEALPSERAPGSVRLHAFMLHVRFPRSLRKDQKPSKKGVLRILGHAVQLFRDSLMITLHDGPWAHDKAEALMLCHEELWKVLSILENDFRVPLIKSRSQNLRCVKAELAVVGEDLAVSVLKMDDFVQCKASEDGKVWLQFDRSKGPAERETVHPDSWFDDGDMMDIFMGDLRDHWSDLVIPSQAQAIMWESIERQNKLRGEVSLLTRMFTDFVLMMSASQKSASSPLVPKFQGVPDYVG